MDQVINNLLSFLTCIVHRHGGRLTIENLSEFQNRDFDLKTELSPEHDQVTLIAVEKRAEDQKPTRPFPRLEI